MFKKIMIDLKILEQFLEIEQFCRNYVMILLANFNIFKTILLVNACTCSKCIKFAIL